MNVKLVIELPKNRNRLGKIYCLDAERQLILGPHAISGRADGITAAQHGNRDRNPLRPYGDFPLGSYQTLRFDPREFGTGTYGNDGILRLKPVNGDGLTAANNGRNIFMIHAGGDGERGTLVPTNGSLRVSPSTMQQIKSLCNLRTAIECQVILSQTPMLTVERIGSDSGLYLGDPAVKPQIQSTQANPQTHGKPASASRGSTHSSRSTSSSQRTDWIDELGSIFEDPNLLSIEEPLDSGIWTDPYNTAPSNLDPNQNCLDYQDGQPESSQAESDVCPANDFEPFSEDNRLDSYETEAASDY